MTLYMKYPVDYKNFGGATQAKLTIEDVNIIEQKMKDHIDLFNGTFGENKWVYTGSSAVAVYAKYHKPELLNTLVHPGDLDILAVSEGRRSDLNFNRIGDYTRDSREPVKSATFKHPDGTSIDVLMKPQIRRIKINDIPLFEISKIIGEYTDAFQTREADLPKIAVLKAIIDDGVKFVSQVLSNETKPAHQDRSPLSSIGLFRPLFSAEEEEPMSPPKKPRYE